MPQLSSPSDDVAEADSSLNTETTNQYVWVSREMHVIFSLCCLP